MSLSGALAGKTIVVTRPRAQCAPLVAAIEAAGGEPLIFPLLEISAADDPAPLAQAVSRLASYRLAIFISPNAVDYAMPAIQKNGAWPAGLVPAAVGPGTVKALLAYGITGCIAPTERFDSEALLALPQLVTVNGQKVVIFRGDGGRELLADTLRERGAEVDCITCYRRAGPSAGPEVLVAAWRAGKLDALTVSSSEALRYLLNLLDDEGRAFLQNTPVFVPHTRIAENARDLGLHKIILTDGADAGILAGLRAYNWDTPARR
jgi:uroporphyrinogen-III synthase